MATPLCPVLIVLCAAEFASASQSEPVRRQRLTVAELKADDAENFVSLGATSGSIESAMRLEDDISLRSGGEVLYNPGFKGWGHSPAGYITDYMIVLLCLFCASSVSRHLETHPAAKHFIIFAVMTALSFGGGGVAHHMMDIYFQRGEVPGFAWGAKNSNWAYPWLLTALTTLGASGAVATTFTFTFWTAAPFVNVSLYAVGGAVAAYEIHVLILENFDGTGFLLSIACIALGLIGFLIALCGIDSSNGCVLLASGMLFYTIAFVFISFSVPDACRTVGEQRADCPYPEAFNQNAIFHVIIMLAVLFLHMAVQRSVQQDEAILASYDPAGDRSKPLAEAEQGSSQDPPQEPQQDQTFIGSLAGRMGKAEQGSSQDAPEESQQNQTFVGSLAGRIQGNP